MIRLENISDKTSKKVQVLDLANYIFKQANINGKSNDFIASLKEMNLSATQEISVTNLNKITWKTVDGSISGAKVENNQDVKQADLRPMAIKVYEVTYKPRSM